MVGDVEGALVVAGEVEGESESESEKRERRRKKINLGCYQQNSINYVIQWTKIKYIIKKLH